MQMQMQMQMQMRSNLIQSRDDYTIIIQHNNKKKIKHLVLIIMRVSPSIFQQINNKSRSKYPQKMNIYISCIKYNINATDTLFIISE